VKLKSLVVITLLVIGCSFASAQTFGFGTAGGYYLYCNYEQISNVAGGIWQVTDNLSACGHSFNATGVGITGGLSAGLNPITGTAIKGVTYGDNLYDAYSYGLTGAQWDVTSALKCAKVKNGRNTGKYGWVGLAAASGFFFGDNYGYVTCAIPGKGKMASKGASMGNAKAPHRK
jgi:hypothetical protein